MPTAFFVIGCPASRLIPASAACLATLAGCTSPATIDRFKAEHGEFISRATVLPPFSLTVSRLPEGTIHNEPGDFSFTQGLFEAFVPIPRDDDSFWIAGALAGVRDVDFEGVPGIADDQLHRYGVRLGYGRFVNDDLLLQGFWQPSVYSDLDGTLNSADYRLYYGSLLAVYRTSPSWFWKVGIAGNDAADTYVIPLGGFAWHFAEQWSVQVLVPRDANLVHQNGPWLVTTGFMMESDEFHVRSPESLDLEDDVDVQEIYAHLTVERRIGPHIGFLIRGGSAVAGDWDWGYGSNTDRYDGTLEPAVFFAAGLTYRF